MATMKMSGCLALVAKMPEADQDALLARVDQYQADGIPAERAQVMAANDVLAEIRAERSQLMSAIAEQHPDLLTADALSDPSAEDQALSFSRRRKADPEKTVTAYKLFRVNEKNPGQLFPLFIGKNDPVEVGTWYDADDIPTKGFSARPGWHAGDSPMATHIGEKSRAGLTAPDRRPANQVWAEIEMAADVDWQPEANKRGTNAQGKVVAVKADIKDQIPEDGFYRYKTNPNMTGNWLIGGSIKVNRVLSDAEVEALNAAAGVADLPREEPFDAERFGLRLSRSRQTQTPEFKRWFGDSKVVNENGEPLVVYHGTADDVSVFGLSRNGALGGGIYFTDASFAAGKFADRSAVERPNGSAGRNVIPVFLKAERLLDLDAIKPEQIAALQEAIPRTAREAETLSGEEFDRGALEETQRNLDRVFDGLSRGYFEPRVLANALGYEDAATFTKVMRRAGFDGIAKTNNNFATEESYREFTVFRPEQVKSATGNNGQFDPANPDITASRQRIVGESKRAYTPEQLQYFENVGRTVTTPTLKERIAELRKDLGKKMAQGMADQFRPISDLGQKAYALARLSRGSSGAFEALLHHGKLSLKDGVYDADQSGGFIERVGVPLQGELEDFLWWVAANRAERLTAEDRERLFTAQDIAAGKSLDQGTADFDYVLQHGPRGGQTTRDRTLIFRDALKTFDEFNKNTLDMAEQSGLIDGASRKIWEHEFYVPFYRVAEEGNDGFSGAAIKNSLVRQEAFKKLKGGKEKLNSDLLANTLANWGHLIDAASKNRAAKETLEAAANLGAAVEADEATIKSMAAAAGKKNQRTWFMDGGVKRHFLIEDQAVVTALTSLDYAGLRGPLWDALTAPKHWLTIGVTASPHFKIKNLIRDSVQAIATSELSYNPVKNIAEGVRASDRNSQTYVSALASGGLIRFGTMLEGSTSKRTRQLIKMGVKDATILDSDNKVQAMYDKFLEPMVMAYNEIGNRGEEINRASLFKQLTDNGMDQAQAALMARDLMDFSMQGSWTWVRVLTQVVPFLNARIQGMYKLGRSAVDDPKRFGIVLGAVAAASVSLLLAYEDDDDWKKREDWDRDTYWWFKVGGTAFRIPKPFEIGAIGTLAERGLEYFMSPEMTNKRFRKVVSGLMLDQLSMNPVPQVFKPLLDLYSNKDSFTGRPIETMGMEKVKPQYRFTDRTSMLARGLSTGTFGALSPVQYDHLVRGYFAWLGSMVVTATDAVLRPLTGQGERATPDYWKLATGGLVSDTTSASSRYVSQMYEQAKELEQAMGTYRMLMKTGRIEEGREFFKDNKQDIVKSAAVDRVKAAESRYNEMIRMIERSKLDPDVKRDRIQAVQVQKDKIARLVAPGYAR